MGRELLTLGVGLTCSVGIMGAVIWSQRPEPVPETHETPAATAAPPPPASAVAPTPVDAARVAELEAAADADAADATPRVALGNLYFEARAFEQAIPWFEAALEIEPDDVDSSTSLGVAYLSSGAIEQSLSQLQRSLEIEPDHLQTLLSIGMVRAFGLDDVEGAAAAWERILEVAPDSPQAGRAREGLRLVAAHDGGALVPPPTGETP